MDEPDDTGIQQEADGYDSGDSGEEDLDHYSTDELRLFSRIGVSSYDEITEKVLATAPPDCVSLLLNTLHLAQARDPSIKDLSHFMPRSEARWAPEPLLSPRGSRIRDEPVARVAYDTASGDALLVFFSVSFLTF